MLMSSLERRFDEFERSTDARVRQVEDFLTRSQRDTQGRDRNDDNLGTVTHEEQRISANIFSRGWRPWPGARIQRGLGKSPR